MAKFASKDSRNQAHNLLQQCSLAAFRKFLNLTIACYVCGLGVLSLYLIVALMCIKRSIISSL